MANYKDFIPSEGFLVKPNIGNIDGHSYFSPARLYSFNDLETAKFGGAVATLTPILEPQPYFSSEFGYEKDTVIRGNRVSLYKATMDVPAGGTLKSLAPDGIPYWTEYGTAEDYKPFDNSAKTTLKVNENGILLTYYFNGYVYNTYSHPDTIAIMGITNASKIFIRFGYAPLFDAARNFTDATNRMNYFNTGTVDTFEVDMEFRDRICFTLPQWQKTPVFPPVSPPDQMPLFATDGFQNIVEIYICRDNRYFPICLDFAVQGKAQSLGASLVGFSTGLTTTRKTEPNYLARNVVEKSYETLKMQFLAKTPEEYQKVKYFLRQASATSHIIHGGLKNYDQEFIFGVVDGQAPLDYRETNKFTINGAGVSFLETDPLKAEKSNEGWG